MANSELITRVKTRLLEYFDGLGEVDFSVEDPEPGLMDEGRLPINSIIDHTLLKPEAKADDIKQLCAEAMEYRFASVCVNPCWIPLAVKELSGSPVKVCTVIGFPLGATTTQAKAFEARQAVELGASEVDMVINIGALRSQDYRTVYTDIRAVVKAAGNSALVKVIIETALLSREEKVAACILASAADADFVKTSTGFAKGGAAVEDVALMREVVGTGMGVKASGGIRDYAAAAAMVKAGADRLGTSSGVAIVKGEAGHGSY